MIQKLIEHVSAECVVKQDDELNFIESLIGMFISREKINALENT